MAHGSQAGVAAQASQSHWITALTISQSKPVQIFIIPSDEALMQVPSFFGALCAAQKILLTTLSVREKTLHDVKELLESSFLGQTACYGIWDLEQCNKQLLPQLLTYFTQYQGPHTLIIAVS